MLKLNILSPELKKEVKYRFFYVSLKEILYILVVSILVHSAFLTAAKNILNVHADETNSRNVLINSKTEDYDKKVKNINEQVDYIAKIQENTIRWSEFISIFSQAVGNGININSLSVDQEASTFAINGFADTRQDLLNFKASMEKLNLFREISIPINSLLEKENISFSFRTEFKSYDFR